MLDNLTSYLNSNSNGTLCLTSNEAKTELLNQFSIATILQKYNRKNEWMAKSLVMYRSTPNLADLSECLSFDKKNGILYKNKSTEFLANAADHLGNFLFNAYQKSSVIEGYSTENEKIDNTPYVESKKLEDIYKFLNSENTHVVTIKKDSRGLGFSITGGKDLSKPDSFSQLIRVSKLYPLQPALASKNLFVGDILLEVNGTSLIGLTNTEALELLRSSESDVSLKVFRPTKYGFPSLTLCKEFWPIALSTSFSKGIDGSHATAESNLEEFEVTINKQDGALGILVWKHEENSKAQGFYVHDLSGEPAASDGRIHIGDIILKVNGIPILPFSHKEALSFIRNCAEVVTLTLLRPNPPVSPLSLEGEVPLGKPLRWEAVEFVNDRMKQKGNSDSTLGRRKMKWRMKKETSAENLCHESSAISSNNSGEVKLYHDAPCAKHLADQDETAENNNTVVNSASASKSSIEVDGVPTLPFSHKEALSFIRSCPKRMTFTSFHSNPPVSSGSFEAEMLLGKPLRWEAELLNRRLKQKDNNECVVGKRLIKREVKKEMSEESLNHVNGVILSDDEDETDEDTNLVRAICIQLSTNRDEVSPTHLTSDSESSNEGNAFKTFEIVLKRGWHTRLGFSLCDPSGAKDVTAILPACAEVKVVYPNSLAAKDGRIHAKDRLLLVDGESLLNRPAAQVIRILRRKTGRIRMVFCRLDI